MEEEFAEMHVEKSPMYSTWYFRAVSAVLKMSFPKASISGDGEEMSFYEQKIQPLEKTDAQMLWWSIYIFTCFLNINKCYILWLAHMQLVGVTRTQQKAFQQSSWLSHCSFNPSLPLLQMTTFKIKCVLFLSEVYKFWYPCRKSPIPAIAAEEPKEPEGICEKGCVSSRATKPQGPEG